MVMTIEQMIYAAEQTLSKACENGFLYHAPKDKDFGYDHLTTMVITMRKMDDTGKVGRWLGWIQCAVVAEGFFTRKAAAALNKEIIDGTYRE